MNKEKLIRDLEDRISNLRYEQSIATRDIVKRELECEITQIYSILNDVRICKYDGLNEDFVSRLDIYTENLQNMYIENKTLLRYNFLYKVIIYTLIVLLFITHAMR